MFIIVLLMNRPFYKYIMSLYLIIFFFFKTILGGIPRWWRNKMKRSPPCPPNTSKIYLPAEHTEYLMNAGRGSETSKKANQSPQNEVGEKQ